VGSGVLGITLLFNKSRQTIQVRLSTKFDGRAERLEIAMKKAIMKLIWVPALALSFSCAIATPIMAQVAIGVSVNFAPPDLPVYEQPPCPGEDYIWNPGFWA
jgi:hypothetical protein